MIAPHFQRTHKTPRIDIANPHDLRQWADRLNVETDLLRDAVLQVGDDAEAVELVLKGTVTAAVTTH
jgi:hypothetical protein